MAPASLGLRHELLNLGSRQVLAGSNPHSCRDPAHLPENVGWGPLGDGLISPACRDRCDSVTLTQMLANGPKMVVSLAARNSALASRWPALMARHYAPQYKTGRLPMDLE
jgi:hypothetical protein